MKNRQQDKIIRDQQQIVDVYKRISSKETLLHGIVHQVLIRTENIETAVWNQKDDVLDFELPKLLSNLLGESQDFLISTCTEINEYLLGARDYLLRKREKIKINVYNEIQSIFKEYRNFLISENILFDIEGPRNAVLKIDQMDFKVIFENLISNSKKSLRLIDERDRKIKVFFEVTPLKLNIFFEDNGIGVEKSKVTHIFTPFYTTHNDGFGMGLSIVDELIKTNNGEINLVIQNRDKTGAKFQLSFDIGG